MYHLGFPAGGESDIAARHQQVLFKKKFRQDMVVQYKTGAGGGVLWAGLGRLWWQWVRQGTPAKGLTGIPAVDAARAAGRAAEAAQAAAGQRASG